MRKDDLLNEHLVPLAEARRDLIPKRNGKPRHPATVWRWINRGLRAPDGERIRLQVLYVDRTPYTSREAVTRFFESLTDARVHREDESAGEPEARSESTENRLRDAGLL